MKAEPNINYNLIFKVIDYIRENPNSALSIDKIIRNLNISRSDFNQLFIQWGGINPEKFLQYINIEEFKKFEREEKFSYQMDFSNINPPHNISIEHMDYAQYKEKSLFINYSFAQSPFGFVIIGSTSKGICYMAFIDDQKKALGYLNSTFPKAVFIKKSTVLHKKVLSIFQSDLNELGEIKLHIKGTDFQLKVWRNLLKIPMGKLSTYGNIAKQIGNPKASRAVGTAIKNNPISFLIPCHRVIGSSGRFGGYMWGKTRKIAIIGWEASKTR